MDFILSDEQSLLAETVRTLYARSYDVQGRRETAATSPGWRSEVWKSLASIGVLELGLGDPEGHPGTYAVEVMVVMSELGAALAPEPFVDAVLRPGNLLAHLGAREAHATLLAQVAEGSTLLVVAGDDGQRCRAWSNTDGWQLSGQVERVATGDCADQFLIVADDEEGSSALFLVAANADGLTRTRYRSRDSRHRADLVLDGVAAKLVASGEQVDVALEATATQAQAAICAEAVGVMAAGLTQTAEYLRTRTQFGVPLSKFQALTHRAADLHVHLELARSMSYYAAMTLAEGRFDPLVAARAKLQITSASRKVGQEIVQMHGGVGVADEHPAGHFFTRLASLEYTYGGRADALNTVVAHVRDHDVVDVY